MTTDSQEENFSFQLDDLGEEVFKRSYAIDEKETWELACLRVSEHVAAAEDGDNKVRICAKVEAELSELSPVEQKEYLKQLGLEKSGLERLIQVAYTTLGLLSFLTAGEKSSSAKASEGQGEVRAWTIKKGAKAPQAAGAIHTDFESHFIKAEIASYADFVEFGGWVSLREKGKVRFEGKEYEMREGDVVEFRVNV